MDFDEALVRRRMTRRFRPDPLPEPLLQKILTAGTRAPSAGFSQGVDLLVLSSDPARSRFWEAASDSSWRDRAAGSAGLTAAPVIVVPVADPEAYGRRYGEQDKADSLLGGVDPTRWPTPFWIVDAAFATMLMLLAAASERIGSLFFQLHAEESAFLAAMSIPSGRRVIGAVALGYPAGDEPATSPSRRARRDFDDVVHLEQW